MPPLRLLLAAACMLGNSLPAFAQTTDVDSNVIEPADFNLSNALLEHGVAVSDIPSLSTLGKPSQPECSVACPFAAKSGGHAAMAGASSAQDGITVSFMNMTDIKLSDDKKIASIEPGNIWGDVYRELTKSDVTVIGGRL
ncbi:hypothetical protein COL922a_010027 [Colletotrichum nupharicola]|nr:hypothetical protein COL922a_010027 [Colletotrichum nupharicola]